MAKKSRQVITMLTQEDSDRLDALARRESMNRSELVREIVRDRLRTEDAMRGQGFTSTGVPIPQVRGGVQMPLPGVEA